MQLPFGRTKELESQMDRFLDIIAKGVLAMREGIRAYLKGDDEEFKARISMVNDLESEADDIRRATESALYTYSLIPESRGDVLGLLENADAVINRAKAIIQQFEVECPDIPAEYDELFMELTDKSIQAADSLVMASRCFFRELGLIQDHINKVHFYESEADRTGLNLRRKIFASDMPLANKQHLRYFVNLLESISDIAENVAERLAIASIKRSI